jgi:hypothetical protein
MPPKEWDGDADAINRLTPAQLRKLWNDIWAAIDEQNPAPTRSALSTTLEGPATPATIEELTA